MGNVKVNGSIWENYNANSGNFTNLSDGKGDSYYHWGALLGFISFIENGFVENPMKRLNGNK